MTEKTIPTKRQARTLRSLKRATSGVVGRTSSVFMRQLTEAKWVKGKPLEDAEGFSAFTITEAGRMALEEFQRALRRPTMGKLAAADDTA